MNVERAKKLTKILMKKHGLAEWRCVFSSQMLWTLAYSNQNNKRLMFSTEYIEYNPFHLVKDTILHEIAHALDDREDVPGFDCHDEVWREIALSVGCNGKAKIDSKTCRLPKYNYKGMCWRCEDNYYSWVKSQKVYCFNCYYLWCEDYDLDKGGKKKIRNYRVRMHKINGLSYAK